MIPETFKHDGESSAEVEAWLSLSAQQILCALAVPDLRREIKSADAIVDKDNASCPRGERAMTLVIELEQCFESVAQVDRRAHSSWSSLSNEWRLRKIEASKQVDVEER